MHWRLGKTLLPLALDLPLSATHPLAGHVGNTHGSISSRDVCVCVCVPSCRIELVVAAVAGIAELADLRFWPNCFSAVVHDSLGSSCAAETQKRLLGKRTYVYAGCGKEWRNGLTFSLCVCVGVSCDAVWILLCVLCSSDGMCGPPAAVDCW